MNAVYRTVGITKQAFHQRMNRQLAFLDQRAQLEVIVHKIRRDHPRMSARSMYRMIKPSCMGRDRFEAWCHDLGLKVKIKRNFRRTTNSLGVTRFENLVTHREVTHVNQVWVSDITYYRINEQFYFLTFIMDQYSRRIVGFAVSKNLRTENTSLQALHRALLNRQCQNLHGLIFHSDGGGQYYSKAFTATTRMHGILNSMAESVYENPYAERINGTIKNQYLKPYNPQSYSDLVRLTAKAVRMYNTQKPHSALKNLSPCEFENQLLVNQKTVNAI